jgi:chromosome partitioning protein
VPSQDDSRKAVHRQLKESLPAQLEQMNIRVFPAIRNSAEFVNASGQGLPLHLYRKSHPALSDFKEIASHLANLIGKPNQKKAKKAS